MCPMRFLINLDVANICNNITAIFYMQTCTYTLIYILCTTMYSDTFVSEEVMEDERVCTGIFYRCGTHTHIHLLPCDAGNMMMTTMTILLPPSQLRISFASDRMGDRRKYPSTELRNTV